MNIYEAYKSKLRTPEEAVKVVKDGDWVDYSQTCSFPFLLDAALAARKDELKDVNLHAPRPGGGTGPRTEAFTFNAWHCSGLDRKYCDKGLAYYSPMLFRDNGLYYSKGYAPVNVAMVTVTPMDKHGFFSFGLTNCCQMEMLRAADTIIFEVNKDMPYTYDAYNGHMHISEMDIVVEGEHDYLPTAPAAASTEIDRQIASHIFPYLRDGITLQIGIGGMPNSLGTLIADSDLKDLGMHTELMSDGYLKLYQAGKITNKMKEIDNGKGVFSICNGSRELYEFLDHNIGIETYPMAYVNNPSVIAQFDNFVSINGCIAMDLYGQVCSETAPAISAAPVVSWTSLPARCVPRMAWPSWQCPPAVWIRRPANGTPTSCPSSPAVTSSLPPEPRHRTWSPNTAWHVCPAWPLGRERKRSSTSPILTAVKI